MSRYQTSALTGMMLDFACAQFDSFCEGITWEFRGDHYVGLASQDDDEPLHVTTIICDVSYSQRMLEICREYKLQHQLVYSPSTNWARGGVIIEREKIGIEPEFGVWFASSPTTGDFGDQSPLVAAMRAFVSSKAGGAIALGGAV